ESATGFKSQAFQPRGIKQSTALMGSKDTLCKVVMLNIGLEDMLTHFTVAVGFKKTLAFQPRLEDALAPFTMEESVAGIKQSTGGLDK
ncbi:unnamed protein product, partial [Symbiodinium necroappetens]